MRALPLGLVLASALTLSGEAAADRQVSLSISAHLTRFGVHGRTATFADTNSGTLNEPGRRTVWLVGSDVGSELYLGGKNALMFCTATFPGFGTLKIEGAMRPRGGGDYDVAVVGGTGVFAGARGTLRVRGTGTWAKVGERSLNEYVLRLPG